LGAEAAAGYQMQRQLSQRQIQAYALPKQVVRYDTSSFSVYHAPPEAGQAVHELLRFGYSKDRRPDLLQFKQGLATLDPAGMPLFTQTITGNVADDGLYVPAWREMVATLGGSDFLFVADCKAACQETRATIAQENGRYLFPLPMTGDTPSWLQAQVAQHRPQTIFLPAVLDETGRPKQYGQGFVVERTQAYLWPDGTRTEWSEQCFITRSDAHAQRKLDALQERLKRTEQALHSLRPKTDERAADFAHRAQQVLVTHQMTVFFQVTVQEEWHEHKRYLRRGRPGPATPFEIQTVCHLKLRVERQKDAIALAEQMAGWRIYVTNSPATEMNLSQAIAYYREEWQVEHGIHRFKGGSLPALPLAVRLPERIRGLMLLLFVALQALTLIEFVSRRSLAQEPATIAGLFPGNPKRQTSRPTAEQLLAVFEYLHLIVEQRETTLHCFLNEPLSKLQVRILDLLQLSPNIYQFGKVLAPP
jgi:transposase